MCSQSARLRRFEVALKARFDYDYTPPGVLYFLICVDLRFRGQQ